MSCPVSVLRSGDEEMMLGMVRTKGWALWPRPPPRSVCGCLCVPVRRQELLATAVLVGRAGLTSSLTELCAVKLAKDAAFCRQFELCSLPEGEEKGSTGPVAARDRDSPRSAAVGTPVWPSYSPRFVSVTWHEAGLSFYTWKWCHAGDEPSRGCNPALCCGFLGSEDIPLIKMFIELLEILTRQCSKSGISTRCVKLYYKGDGEAGSDADGPQRNASQKQRQHQEKGRG